MAKKWLLSFMFSYLIFSQLAVTETYHPPKSQLCHFFNHFIHFLGNLSRCFSITLGLCVLLKNEIIVSFWQKSEYSTFESNKLYIYNTDLHTRLAFNLCSWNYSPKMWWICNSSVSRQVYCTSGRWWEHHRYKLLWCVILICDGPKQGCYGATRAYRDKTS